MNTPYAYAIVQGEDGRENVSLQFDHPEMCGQKYNAVIPLYTHPHPDNLGLAESIIKQQQIEIEALKKENDHLLMVHNYKGAGFK